MTKVYKMPVSQAIYNDSDIRMEVTNEEIVDCWKAFFDANENWRDFDSDMTYEKYRNITDKAHLKKIIQMPVNFLIKSCLLYTSCKFKQDMIEHGHLCL